MVVYDFDGVLVESSRTEKIWRWLAIKMNVKTPKFLFFLQEIIEFILNKKLKLIKKTNELKQNGCLVGLITDRSFWSLCMLSLKNNNGLNFNFENFNFIQTRKSVLDYFIEEPLFFLPTYANHFVSKKTKPDIQVLENLKNFAAKNNILLEEVLIVDDLRQAIEIACVNGFSAINVKHINYIRYI